MNTVFGSVDQTSYVSVDDATNYMNTRYGAGDWMTLHEAYGEQAELIIREWLLVTASRVLDTLPLRYGRFFSLERGFLRPQGLKMPWAAHPYLYLRASGGQTDAVVASELADPDRYLDDLFAGGSVIVARGTGRGQSASVTAYDATTGTLSLDPALSIAVDETTEFYLLYPPDTAIVHATIEQAYHLLLASPPDMATELDAADSIVETGISAYSISGLSVTIDRTAGAARSLQVCRASRALMRPYLARVAGGARG